LCYTTSAELAYSPHILQIAEVCNESGLLEWNVLQAAWNYINV